jgi:hypothetical protein
MGDVMEYGKCSEREKARMLWEEKREGMLFLRNGL